MELPKGLVIVTDGGCRGNGTKDAACYSSLAIFYNGQPQPLGWETFAKMGTKSSIQKTGHTLKYEWPNLERKTNQSAELAALGTAIAVIETLGIKNFRPIPATILTDSQLVVGVVNDGYKLKKSPWLEKIAQPSLAFLSVHPEVTVQKVTGDWVKTILGH